MSRIQGNPQKYLKVKEVAQELRVTKRTIFRYIESGKLKATKIGQWRVTRTDLNSFVSKFKNK